jgi:CRISPR-associated Csx10 family RAMP protein
LDGLPYLPASTLKGRVRDAAERLAQNLGHDICEGPNPHRMCGAMRPAAQFCLICRAFGSPGVSAMSGQTGLLWRDAKLCDSQGKPINDVNRQEAEAYYYARTQAQLSRPRATALEKHLFTSENTLEDLRFSASIRGWLPQTTTIAGQFPAELVLLLSGLKLLNFVGGGKSRGLGFCAVELPDHFELDNRNGRPRRHLRNHSFRPTEGELMPRMKMKFVLKSEAPIAILRSRATSQFVKTLDYLPGGTVRGAFAEIFINKRGIDHDFKRLFIEEKIRFSDFLPSNSTDLPLLMPLTAAACKRHGLEHQESLRDRLWEEIKSSTPAKQRCTTCGEPLDRIGGYLIGATTKQKVEIGKQLRMHVGISRATGSAMQGLLFSYEMLTEKSASSLKKKAPALMFVGTLQADEVDTAEVFAILQQVVPDREHLSIGKARTRGLGELSIALRGEWTEPEEFEFNKRWQSFNKNASAECFFAITLDSHLALKDKLGRPVLDDLSAAHFGFGEKEQVKLRARFLAPAVVAGWNAAQGLPKPDTHAISRGSVVAFAPKDSAEALHKHLQQLETAGLGERRAEGFGKLTVCHPFHSNFGKE